MSTTSFASCSVTCSLSSTFARACAPEQKQTQKNTEAKQNDGGVHEKSQTRQSNLSTAVWRQARRCNSSRRGRRHSFGALTHPTAVPCSTPDSQPRKPSWAYSTQIIVRQKAKQQTQKRPKLTRTQPCEEKTKKTEREETRNNQTRLARDEKNGQNTHTYTTPACHAYNT